MLLPAEVDGDHHRHGTHEDSEAPLPLGVGDEEGAEEQHGRAQHTAEALHGEHGRQLDGHKKMEITQDRESVEGWMKIRLSLSLPAMTTTPPHTETETTKAGATAMTEPEPQPQPQPLKTVGEIDTHVASAVALIRGLGGDGRGQRVLAADAHAHDEAAEHHLTPDVEVAVHRLVQQGNTQGGEG